MTSGKFKSSVLRCYAGDDDCACCRFIDGNHETATLLEVIRIMDEKLAEEEEFSRHIYESDGLER